MQKIKFGVNSLLAVVMLLTVGMVNVGDCGELPEITLEPFPILSWIPPELTAEGLGLYKDAGFNILYIYPEEDVYRKMKKNWDGKWMVFKEWNEKGYDYKTLCDFHADDPQRIGFMLGDEPTVAEIDEYVEQYDYLRSRHPDDICLVNMFPSYASETRLGSTFRQYVETYFAKLRPRYSSLDHYPCYWHDYDSPSFYHDLEISREVSSRYNCKQFGFVQVYSSRKDRDVSSSDLAWQINTFLAYNCKGLWYFYFRNPVPGINDLVGRDSMKRLKQDECIDFRKGRRTAKRQGIYRFGRGVLDADDQKSDLFDDVSQINKEASVWGETLIGLKCLKIRHFRGFDDGYAPVGTAEFARLDWDGAVEQYVEDIKAAEEYLSMGYILSYFEDGQKRPYLMIVNKRHGEWMRREDGTLATVVSFTKDVKNVFSVSNVTGKEERGALDKANSFEVELSGGGAVLLRLEVE